MGAEVLAFGLGFTSSSLNESLPSPDKLVSLVSELELALRSSSSLGFQIAFGRTFGSGGDESLDDSSLSSNHQTDLDPSSGQISKDSFFPRKMRIFSPIFK